MSLTRAYILFVAFVLGLAALSFGAATIANGTPYETCYTSFTGFWGILPALIGLVILVVVAFVAWDSAE